MRNSLFILASLLLVLPAGVQAQDHDHSAQGQPSQPPVPSPSPQDQAGADHGAMDHSAMDHGEMDHSAMHSDHASQEPPIPQGPPPPEAFAGPLYAADAHVGAERMAASRAAVVHEVSGMPVFWLQAERAEYRQREGHDGYVWDVQGYYGGDIDKFWFKSEGEGSFGESAEQAEMQALWSHAIDPWWDVQFGVKQGFTGPLRTHAVFGIQGLAPYLFEVDAAVFFSHKGDVTARIEAELDQRITQRLILQPRLEINLAAQDIAELGTGSGLDSAEIGLRLRYEITRQFAPYLGVEQEWKAGRSADYARAAGEDASVTNYVIGVRFWF